MNYLRWVIVLIIAAEFACGTSPEKIKIGTPKNEVLKSLGKPSGWKSIPFTSSGPSERIKVGTVFSVDSLLAQEIPSDEMWIFEYQPTNGKVTSIYLRDGRVVDVTTEEGKQ